MSRGAAILAQITQLITDYKEVADRMVKHANKIVNARAYGEGDRPGHTLALLLRQAKGTMDILRLRDDDGTILYDTTEILNSFASYPEALYDSKTSVRTSRIFLHTLIGSPCNGWRGRCVGI